MDNEDEGAHPDKVGGPGEHDQGDGGLVVDEHLPEVFPLDVKELAEGEGPVECHLQHVVQPNISGNLMIKDAFIVSECVSSYLVFGIVDPANIDVPEPRLVPQDYCSVDEYRGVEHEPPSCLTELLQSGG